MSDAPEFAVLQTVENEFNAQSLVVLLRDAGIDAQTIPRAAHDAIPGLMGRGASGEVAILVPRHQLEDARRIIDSPPEQAESEHQSDPIAGQSVKIKAGRPPLLARIGILAGLLILTIIVAAVLIAVLFVPWS